MMQSLVILSLISTAAAFSGPALRPVCPSRTALFGGAGGYATTMEGKQARVETVKGLLDTSQMIFTIPASGITVTQSQNLRRSLPEGTTMSVIKNKLMNRAVEGTKYEPVGEMLKGANMWFFIEEDMGGTVKAFNQFTKEANLRESHGILGGNFDGENLDSNGVKETANLPTKIESIQRAAGSIKAISTKVARVIKEPSSKLARAFSAVADKKE